MPMFKIWFLIRSCVLKEYRYRYTQDSYKTCINEKIIPQQQDVAFDVHINDLISNWSTK